MKPTTRKRPINIKTGRGRPHFQRRVTPSEGKKPNDLLDVSDEISSVMELYPHLPHLEGDQYFEFVAGSLFRHGIIDGEKIINYEKNRFTSEPMEEFIAHILPVFVKNKDLKAINSFHGDMSADMNFVLIDSNLASYKEALSSFQERMSRPDSKFLALPIPANETGTEAPPAALTRPKEAPELWENAPRSEKILQFIDRVWMPYIKSGSITQSDLRTLNPKLYWAFHNYCSRNKVDSKTIIPAGRSSSENLLGEYTDLTYENSLGLAFQIAHTHDSVPSEIVRRGEAFYTLYKRRKLKMKPSSG